MIKRKGDWIQTYTGIQFWPLEARPEEILIEDIAHSLSLLCRFNGHCNRFYSVAEHSIHVANLLPQEFKMWGLLHDATEAYIADIPMPLKRNLPDYKTIENDLMRVVASRFGLLWPMPQEVKHFDSVLLATEKVVLMGKEPAPWHMMPEPVNSDIIQGLNPGDAEELFLETSKMLLK
jgi:uncharacterized protein